MDKMYLDEDYNANNELIEEFNDLLAKCYMMMFALTMSSMSSWDFFNADELKKGGIHLSFQMSM